jgi:hypothetical protein
LQTTDLAETHRDDLDPHSDNILYLGQNIPSQIPRNSKLTALFGVTVIAFEINAFMGVSIPDRNPEKAKIPLNFFEIWGFQ